MPDTDQERRIQILTEALEAAFKKVSEEQPDVIPGLLTRWVLVAEWMTLEEGDKMLRIMYPTGVYDWDAYGLLSYAAQTTRYPPEEDE